MVMRRVLVVLLVLAVACGGRERGDDDDDDATGDGDADADADGDSDADADADADGDADADADGDADACAPDPGGQVLNASCDEVEIAVLEAAAGVARLQVRGRVSLWPGEGVCAVVDSVDVYDGDQLVQTLDGAPAALGLDGTTGLLATGEADGSLVARCGRDDGWASGAGLVVRGRADGGTFEARCGSVDFGTGWPPPVIRTCHEGLGAPPGAGDAMITGGDGFTWTDLYAYVPHGEGGAVTGIDSEVRVLPSSDPFGGLPIDPFDTTGWSAWVGETDLPGTGAATQVSLHADGDPLGLEVCPVTPPEPGPEDPLPPVFLARLTGTTESGPLSTEVYVRMCTRAIP